MMTCGVDMCRISRMADMIQNERFRLRYFGEGERAELDVRGNPAQGYAAAFAAKEAFSKALRTGVRGFSLCEVELLHEENGAPYLRLSGKAEQIALEKKMNLSVSITHEGDYAVAMVVGYMEG